MFKPKKSSYSETLAIEVIDHENIYLVGRVAVPQREYVNDRPTEKISGFQVWCATDTNNPFKIKFAVEDKPVLDDFQIGDVVTFEKLEAIDIRGNIFFRAKAIKKAK